MKPSWNQLLAATVCIAAGVAMLYLALTTRHERSQTLILPDGGRLRFLTVTYGTNHVVGGSLAQLANRAPRGLRSLLRRVFGSYANLRASRWTNPAKLVFWCEALPPTSLSASRPGFSPTRTQLRAVLADQNGILSGESVCFMGRVLPPTSAFQTWTGSASPPSPSIVDFDFGAFPRRSAVIELRVFEDTDRGDTRQLGCFRIANPKFGSYPQWQAEWLPAVRRTDEVEVVLTEFDTGHSWNSRHEIDIGPAPAFTGRAANRSDGWNYCVFWAQLRRLADPDQSWLITATLSDATGNEVVASGVGPAFWFGNSTRNGAHGYSFEPALWPDEKAWKLRLELKKYRVFSTNELVVLRRLALPALDHTNRPSISAERQGVTVTLTEIGRQPPGTQNSASSAFIELTHSRLPPGLNLDLVSVVQDDQQPCRFIPMRGGPGVRVPQEPTRRYVTRNLSRTAKTVDITLAIHPTRTVEFLVKPELAKAGKGY